MQDDLHHLLNFTPEDLELNRHGEISARQQAMLRHADREETTGLLIGLGIIGVLIVPFCAICAVLFNVRALLAWVNPTLVAVLLGIVGVFGLLMTYANWIGHRQRSRAPQVVAAIDEWLDFRVEERGAHEYYYVRVGDAELRVPYETFAGLQRFQRDKAPNLLYRLYHTPHTNQILSIEMLVDDDSLLE